MTNILFRISGSTLHTYQSVDLELYFANSEGDKLVTETEHVRYNSNTLKEKLIVEELMKGPFAETHKKVIPMDTVLLGVSVKDDICYVNFDNGFLNMTDIQPEVTIYSIVNSIIRGGSASKVQILVNGDSNLKYQVRSILASRLQSGKILWRTNHLKNRPLCSLCLVIAILIGILTAGAGAKFVSVLRPSPVEQYGEKDDWLSVRGQV